MEHTIYVVLEALVCLGLGSGLGYWLRRPSAPAVGTWSDVVPTPTRVERADSPFVTCRFITKSGVVVATKRLRRESITTSMLWGGLPYRQVARNHTLNHATFERE